MSVASNGTEKEDQTQLETDTNSLDQTYELWQHLAREEKKSLPCPNVMTKRQRKKFTKTLLRGFASGSKPNFRVSNLFSYEKRFSSCSKLSSDSESVEVDDLQRSQQLWVYLLALSFPLVVTNNTIKDYFIKQSLCGYRNLKIEIPSFLRFLSIMNKKFWIMYSQSFIVWLFN